MTARVVGRTNVTVPRKNPLPRPPRIPQLDLRRIGSDRSTGAHGLALAGLHAIDRHVATWWTRPPSDLGAACRAVARELRRTQPAMGPFQQWALDWAEISRTVPPRELRPRVRRWLSERRHALLAERERLVRVARRRFPSRALVLTLSRSESVRRSLVGVASGRRPREVVVLESLPGGEGRAQARDLRREGLRARWVSDSDGAKWARAADLLLIGADAVYQDGSVVHKVGTRRLAGIARGAGVPVVVITGHSKAVRRPRPSAPLGPGFDRTPASCISEYWTDRGMIPGGMWSSSRWAHR